MSDLGSRASELWGPYVEWTLEADADQPFEIGAQATFTHDATGESVTTGIFPTGDGTWAFRFANSRVGSWSCITQSTVPDLSGRTARVIVEPSEIRGALSHTDHWWTWSESGEVIVPQLVMYNSPERFANDPDKIDADITTFIDGHGFNGFHVPVFCRWLDLDKETNPEFDDPNPLPDPRTFDALELLIQKTYAAGGLVHLWLWGDNDADHRMTPMRDDWGGQNGPVANRLYRYIAARLGPVTGWSMGYGFDLEHWVGEDDLRIWHDTMTTGMGWPHLLGGRSGRPKDAPELLQIYDGLDYAGYTHHRPSYDDYLAAVDTHPDRPVFSEDRFRIRVSDRFSFKDYDETLTRRGIWHSTMAGGVANIWGKMAEGAKNGQSVPYPNVNHIATAMKFFEGRLSTGMVVDRQHTDGHCLHNDDRTLQLCYKEDTDSITIASGETGQVSGHYVDACAEYSETEFVLSPESQTLRFPHSSDWAVVVRET